MSTERSAQAPRVSMAGFAEYVGAPTSGRIDCVQRQLRNYDADYRPGSDFYKDFVDGLKLGRREDNDELCLQRAISKQNVATRAQHYRELRDHWLAMSDLHLPTQPVGRSHWNVPGLRISVGPELALIQPTRTLVVKLWLRQSAPTADAIKAMQWLLVTHMPHLIQGGTAAVLDLRRQKSHVSSKRAFRRGYEGALRLDAETMGRMWLQLARTA